MKLNLDSRDAAYVARQPIVDWAGKTFGYELLYRGAAEDTACTAEGDLAASRVLSDTVLSLGLDTLTAGHLAFVNLTRPLLIGDAGTLLPRESTVLELREDIQVDVEVIEACKRLHGMGYALALDDFVSQSEAEVLLPYAKYVKINLLATPADAWGPLAERLKTHNVRLIAEKAETADTVKAARAAGYSLFQGYFFCRPSTFGAAAVPARQMAYLTLLSALSKPNLTIAELEDLIKHDVSLTYRVLRCINSAAYGLRTEIHSIRQALVLMGIGQIRKWASVWTMAGLNNGSPETVTVALLRARCCELLGEVVANSEAASEYFLLGLCSLLDALLERPMADALQDMPLPGSIKDALLGQQNKPRGVLEVVIAYERGEWETAAECAQKAGIGPAMLPAAYSDALRWARELSRPSPVAARAS